MHNVAKGGCEFPYLSVSVFPFRPGFGERKNRLCVKREERFHHYFYVFDDTCDMQLCLDLLAKLITG